MLVSRWIERLVGMTDRQLSGRAKSGLDAHRDAIMQVAGESRIPPALLAGLVAVESEARAEVESTEELPSRSHAHGRTRAQGLMQVTPRNLAELEVPPDRWLKPVPNLRAGVTILLEPPEPLGEVALEDTLHQYRFGSLDRDATDYIRDVETLAARAWDELAFPALPTR